MSGTTRLSSPKSAGPTSANKESAAIWHAITRVIFLTAGYTEHFLARTWGGGRVAVSGAGDIMKIEWLFAWYNVIFLVPFVVAMLYVGIYAVTGLTFGDADIDADADVDADAHVEM